MKAIRFHKNGGPEVLQLDQVPEPAAGPGQVLIKVDFASINYADIGRRKGQYPTTAPLPAIPGLEVSGTVAALGAGVSKPAVGTRVMARAVPYGYAEYTVAPVESVFPVPAALSMEEAAAALVIFMTGWMGIVLRGQAKVGETALIHAAGSGCGMAGIQIAKLSGLKVITTASTAEKLEKAKKIGADHAINYTTQDFAAEVLRITSGRGADLIYDGVGGEVLAKSIGCVAAGGRVISYGSSSGQTNVTFGVRDLFGKNAVLAGISAGTAAPDDYRKVLDILGSGAMRPVIDRAFPLERAAEAHRYLEGRTVFGKVVLKVS